MRYAISTNASTIASSLLYIFDAGPPSSSGSEAPTAVRFDNFGEAVGMTVEGAVAADLRGDRGWARCGRSPRPRMRPPRDTGRQRLLGFFLAVLVARAVRHCSTSRAARTVCARQRWAASSAAFASFRSARCAASAFARSHRRSRAAILPRTTRLSLAASRSFIRSRSTEATWRRMAECFSRRAKPYFEEKIRSERDGRPRPAAPCEAPAAATEQPLSTPSLTPRPPTCDQFFFATEDADGRAAGRSRWPVRTHVARRAAAVDACSCRTNSQCTRSTHMLSTASRRPSRNRQGKRLCHQELCPRVRYLSDPLTTAALALLLCPVFAVHRPRLLKGHRLGQLNRQLRGRTAEQFRLELGRSSPH